uniref:Putative ovule protein n=1 Tax=Solanum chacoense TaxID=4108 RepID=A0A0V0HAY0_SOLCH
MNPKQGAEKAWLKAKFGVIRDFLRKEKQVRKSCLLISPHLSKRRPYRHLVRGREAVPDRPSSQEKHFQKQV